MRLFAPWTSRREAAIVRVARARGLPVERSAQPSSWAVRTRTGARWKSHVGPSHRRSARAHSERRDTGRVHPACPSCSDIGSARSCTRSTQTSDPHTRARCESSSSSSARSGLRLRRTTADRRSWQLRAAGTPAAFGHVLLAEMQESPHGIPLLQTLQHLIRRSGRDSSFVTLFRASGPWRARGVRQPSRASPSGAAARRRCG